MYAGTTPACGNTCVRGAGTHGDVLNLHTGVFQHVTHTATATATATHDNDDDDNDNDTQQHTFNRTTPTNQPRAQFDSTRENSPGPNTVKDRKINCSFFVFSAVVQGRSLLMECFVLLTPFAPESLAC